MGRLVDIFSGQVISPHLSDQMSQRSQVSGVALCMPKVKVPSVQCKVTYWAVMDSVKREISEISEKVTSGRPGDACKESAHMARTGPGSTTPRKLWRRRWKVDFWKANCTHLRKRTMEKIQMAATVGRTIRWGTRELESLDQIWLSPLTCSPPLNNPWHCKWCLEALASLLYLIIILISFKKAGNIDWVILFSWKTSFDIQNSHIR